MTATLRSLLTEARDELKAEPEMWELVGRIDAALAAPEPEPIGEVVIGEEGTTKGWTVIRWRADLPPVAVGTKLYAEAPAAAAVRHAPAQPLTLPDSELLRVARGVIDGNTIKLTRDVGAYEVTEPTHAYRCLADALVAAAAAQEQP